MSEPIPACILIGGKLPKDQVGLFCQAIIADGVALEWGDSLFRPKRAKDLLEVCREEQGASVLWLCDDQANWGRFPALEEFLTNNGELPFDLRSHGKAEFDPDLTTFRPGQKPVRISTSANGQPVIAAQLLTPGVQQLTKAIDAGQKPAGRASAKRALKCLQALIPPTPTPLPPFEID